MLHILNVLAQLESFAKRLYPFISTYAAKYNCSVVYCVHTYCMLTAIFVVFVAFSNLFYSIFVS